MNDLNPKIQDFHSIRMVNFSYQIHEIFNIYLHAPISNFDSKNTPENKNISFSLLPPSKNKTNTRFSQFSHITQFFSAIFSIKIQFFPNNKSFSRLRLISISFQKGTKREMEKLQFAEFLSKIRSDIFCSCESLSFNLT